MKFSVPTNWQPDLLEKLNKNKIEEIYGKLDADIIGGGRPSVILPYITRSEAERHILLVHKYGLEFNYLLNASCLGNVEWTSKGQREIRSFLDWLAKVKVDSITVTVPYLLQMIKKCYPNFKVKASVSAKISTPLQAKYWEDLGVDEINLATWSVNRNFQLLRQIRKSVKCILQTIANQRCLLDCPFTNYHYVIASHSSANNGSNRGFYIEYCGSMCRYLFLLEPWRLITACWIRPEDLHYYAEIGIDKIKLLDRTMKTEEILRIVDAYTFEKYDGNLMDLFLVNQSQLITSSRNNIFKKIKYLFNFRNVNIFRLRHYFKFFKEQDPTYLDNKKLDNFLDFFVKGKCDISNCDNCGYCKMIADKTLYIPKDYREKMLKVRKNFLDEIISGSIFRYAL